MTCWVYRKEGENLQEEIEFHMWNILKVAAKNNRMFCISTEDEVANGRKEI